MIEFLAMLKRQGLALLHLFVRLFPRTFNKNIEPDDFSTQKEAAAKSSFCNSPFAYNLRRTQRLLFPA
jgi:hypothetical protein